MFKSKLPALNAILIVNLVFIVAGLFLCVMSIINAEANFSTIVAAIFKMIALIDAIVYIFMGYGKKVAKFYFSFGLLFAIAQIFSLASLSVNSGDFVLTVLSALTLVFILVLIFSENFGKKNSLLTCLGIIILSIASLLYNIILGSGVLFYGADVVKIILSCVYTTMTYAKYIDKERRGTK